MADGVKKGWGTLGGGSGKMHKFAPTGTQTPDRTSQEGHSGSRRDIKVQAGGANAGFYSSGVSNKSHAGTQTPGQTAAQPTSNEKFAKGGSTKMFGNRGSQRAEAGKTSP